MAYDKNGLGYSEVVQVALYWPSIAVIVDELLDAKPSEAIKMCRSVIDCFNLGLIEMEVK